MTVPTKKTIALRQRFRNVVRSSGHGSTPPPPPDPPPNSSAPVQAATSYSTTLLERALLPLSDDERTVICEHIHTASTDINHALNDALAAAERKQQLCLDRRWTLTVGGHQIALQQQASKVVQWLNRFRAIGDVAVNADPVHAGLPWAGIRFLLEAAVTEENQMRSLVVGLELALYMANRLKAYNDFLQQLPAMPTRDQFETALTHLYTHILRFLAQAIQNYQMSALRRTVRAFGSESEIQKFEEECDKLAFRAEIEASNCDRSLNIRDRQILLRFEQQIQQIHSQHISHGSLDQVNLQAALDKLPTVERAEFDAYGVGHNRCHPETRRDILCQIHDWALGSNSKHIFWLSGAAGSGKSTISQSVAARLADEGCLGASFFFKRGDGDRGSAARFFPTIARQLTTKVPEFAGLVAQVVRHEPGVCAKLLGEQFDKLIYKPIQRLTPPINGQTWIVVVDALDECENQEDIRVVLQLWSRLPQITSVSLKLLLTSRPELPILMGFSTMSDSIHQDVVLHDLSQTVVKRDMWIYLRDAFSHIQREHNAGSLLGVFLDDGWPDDQKIHELVDRAFPLFIVAATIKRFVGDPNEHPQERLDKILGLPGTGHISQMQFTYLPVLGYLSLTSSDDNTRVRLQQDFRDIVGSIVVLAEPLSIASLAALLRISPARIESRLKPLRSVLRLSKEPAIPVQIFHLSFREFLLDDSLQGEPYHIDSSTTHTMLLTRCLELLSGETGLHENMTGQNHPGQLRRDIPQAAIINHLPPELQYACQYWVYHVQQSKVRVCDGDQVHTFLQAHFLHWLESLSLMGKVSETITCVSQLQFMVSHDHGTETSVFLGDARRFVLAHRHIVDLAPLQIYASAVIFTPQDSIVRTAYDTGPEWIQRLPRMPKSWGPQLQTLEAAHNGAINALHFSPNGQLIASGSQDRTVRLWDASTGQNVQTLEGHVHEVRAVTFSPDGQLLASSDSSIHIWNVNTGQQIQKLEAHTHRVWGMDFSPNGHLLASASWDQTVCIWDTITWQKVRRLTGQTFPVGFSPCGRFLASSSWEGVTLWDIGTWQVAQKLEECIKPISTIVFSPDSQLLASASKSVDNSVVLWDLNKGQKVQKLEGMKTGATSEWTPVDFSFDGQLLASGDAHTIRLWNVSTGQEVQKLSGHADWVVQVVFSPNKRLLASASYDSTVRLWEVDASQKARGSDGHHNRVRKVRFSPNGKLLASVSQDRTVELWDPITGQKLQSLEAHIGWTATLAFSPDSQLLASSSNDGTIILWNSKSGHELRRLKERDSAPWTLVFSSDGQTLASETTNENAVIIWDVSTGQELRKLKGNVRCLRAMSFSADGQLLAVAYSTLRQSRDYVIILWNVHTGQAVQILEGYANSISAVSLSLDNQLLVSGEDDGTIRLWDIAQGREVQRLVGHTGTISAVAFSSDVQLLASAGRWQLGTGPGDDTVRLWDISSGKEMQRFDQRGVYKITFSEDGLALLTNRGIISLQSVPFLRPTIMPGHKLRHENGITLNGEWVEHNGRRLVWLPYEYRGQLSAVHGHTIAIGQESGQVSFITLDPTRLPGRIDQ